MRAVLTGLVFIFLAACSTEPSASAGPPSSSVPGATMPTIKPVVGTGMVNDRATVVVPVQPRWTPGEEGIGMTDEWAEHPAVLEPPVPVSVLDGPTDIDGADWYRVYVLPDAMRWPGDFVAWVPAAVDGVDVLAFDEPSPCPDATVAQLGMLSPSARVGCFGDQALTLVARSWRPGHWTPYEVDPAWFGSSALDDRSISLFDSDGGEFPRPPDTRISWIDARVPPDLATPPVGMTLLVKASFDHPDAARCVRVSQELGQPRLGGLPDEEPDASATWCRGQLVLTDWEILLGPEARPPVAGDVQLHRTTFEGGECAGVGMSMLRFRMDIREADPIWLEAEDFPGRVIPVFGRSFDAVTQPELAVVDRSGNVIARDGTVLDPDRPFAGHFVCPMGDTVSITGP
jgi:hypothetical protein